jgi:hypothetical protein
MGYLALFLLAHRPVALRLGSAGWMVLTMLALRSGLVAAGYRLEVGPDTMLAGTALFVGVSLRMGARIWLVRAAAEDLREQIQSTARGLFLECEEPRRGCFLLTARGMTSPLRMLEVGRRMMLVILPRSAGQGKVALLIRWLSKQYSGPVPRVHRVLKRREP